MQMLDIFYLSCKCKVKAPTIVASLFYTVIGIKLNDILSWKKRRHKVFLNGSCGYKTSISVIGIYHSDDFTNIFRSLYREPEFSMSQIEQIDNFRHTDLIDHNLKIRIGIEQHLV